MAVIGTYCLLNFLHCRETHCAVTGPASCWPRCSASPPRWCPAALSWYRAGTEVAVYLVILVAGYALEWAVAARTGRRVLR